MKNALNLTPELVRTSLASGLSDKEPNPVDRDGGDFGAGIIKGFAVLTRGEALGHDLWIDSDFMQSVAGAINSTDAGHKSRFTHPGLSSDGLGKYLGRTKDAEVDGDVVRADKHFAKSAHKTPDGDLAGYLMDRAEEDPSSFGASISFRRDRDAEDAFVAANSPQAGDGKYRKFTSPDPLNTKNLPHARLKQLKAVDIVDDPAANPSGMFHRGQEIASEAEALASFALGLSTERPDIEQLGIDPDRATQFLSRFLERHNLAVVPKPTETTMSAETKPEEKPAEKPAEETKPTETKPAETPAEKPAEKPAEETKPAADPKLSEKPAKTGKDFLAAFGTQGAVWFAEGKTWKEAKQLHTEALAAENVKLKAEVADLNKKLGRGEPTPVQFQAEQTAEQKAEKAMQNKVGSPAMAKFAANIKFAAGAEPPAGR